MTEEQIAKLQEIIGNPLSYSKLCDAIGLPKKMGNQKKAQIRELQYLCDMEITSNPTRYTVYHVFAQELELLGLADENNKFQLSFDMALYKWFLKSKTNVIYITNTEALMLFGEVNKNFKYSANEKSMALLGSGFSYFPEMNKTVMAILNRWTQRRLENMENRMLFVRQIAFRLYKINEDGYIIKQDVNADSELGSICLGIWNQAIQEIMPENWGDPAHGGQFYVSDERYFKFNKRITELTEQRFKGNGDYIDMHKTTAIVLPEKSYLKQEYEILLNTARHLPDINREAKNKILNTKQLNKFTDGQKLFFIDINIGKNPSIDLHKEIEKREDECIMSLCEFPDDIFDELEDEE